jgi:hypothetical protein
MKKVKTRNNSLAAHHAIPVNKINRRKSKAFRPNLNSELLFM